MSADNRYVLRKNSDGKYIIQKHCTGSDNSNKAARFDSLEEAIEWYSMISDDLTVELPL